MFLELCVWPWWAIRPIAYLKFKSLSLSSSTYEQINKKYWWSSVKWFQTYTFKKGLFTMLVKYAFSIIKQNAWILISGSVIDPFTFSLFLPYTRGHFTLFSADQVTRVNFLNNHFYINNDDEKPISLQFIQTVLWRASRTIVWNIF